MSSKNLKIAEEVKTDLIKQGLQAEIAGSLRRKEYSSHDIDIVCGDPKLSPETQKIYRFTKIGENVDLYIANPLHFGAMLLTYTGPKGSNIGLRMKAKSMGMKLNQYGLYDWKTGRLLASKTEKEILSKLRHPYKEPYLRGK